jgi:hypothetical protein
MLKRYVLVRVGDITYTLLYRLSLSNPKTTSEVLFMVINKELDSTNLPSLPSDLSRKGPQYSQSAIFNA